jgi:predicted secreted protein
MTLPFMNQNRSFPATWRRGLWAAPVFAAALCAAQVQAQAGEPPALSGVVSLSTSASVDVPRDLLSVTLSVTREGAEAAAVQTALKQALDAALAEARPAAKPGQIDVRTGGFSLQPRYSSKNAINGWQGTAELVIEGRDLAGISALAGRLTTLTVARIAQGLSREQREKAEASITTQAIARYRAQASDVAKAFGYSSFTVREVNVGGDGGGRPMPMMMSARAASADAAPVPVAVGQETVSVTVSGTVQMLK